MSEKNTSRLNSSLERGMQVLEAFEYGAEMSLKEITATAGLEKSAVQRFVATLLHLGYLDQDPQTRRYRLSPLVLNLGFHFLKGNPLVERARPYLFDCRNRTGETVNLFVPHKDNIILALRFPGAMAIRAEIDVGASFGWAMSAGGQSIAAHLPSERREALIACTTFVKHARNTIMDPDAMRARLEEIRRNGYTVTEDESYDGDITVAAPVFDQLGQPQGAVSIALFASRWNVEDARAKLGPVTKELAHAVSIVSPKGAKAGSRW